MNIQIVILACIVFVLAATAEQEQHIDHVLIVPYRNRSYHMQKFLDYMPTYLLWNFPHESFAIYVIEQDNNKLFRKNWVFNAGLVEVLRASSSAKCITMHDVDMIPITAVPFNSCNFPREQIREVHGRRDWKKPPYPRFFGGVVTLSREHWIQVNGMANAYKGWGCADDDMYFRLRANDLLHISDYGFVEPRRPLNGQGIFVAIEDSLEHHPTDNYVPERHHYNCKVLLAHMKTCSERWKQDGLSNLCYKVTDKTVIVEGTVSIHHIKVSECIEEAEEEEGSTFLTEREVTSDDTGLLEAYLEKHPYDAYAWFDLAEILDKTGKKQEALYAYHRRLEAHWGIPDYRQIPDSQLAIGEILKEQDRSEGEVVNELLAIPEMLDFLGSQSLYFLARYFREKGKLHTACIFALPAAQMSEQFLDFEPKLPSQFFWPSYDELCVCGFYAGLVAKGRHACQLIIQLKEAGLIQVPEGHLDRIQRNLEFYAANMS